MKSKTLSYFGMMTVCIVSLFSGVQADSDDGPEASANGGNANVCVGDIICAPCTNVVGASPRGTAVVGFVQRIKMNFVDGVASDEKYGAVGTFVELAPETNSENEILFYKYEIQDGATRVADKCY